MKKKLLMILALVSTAVLLITGCSKMEAPAEGGYMAPQTAADGYAGNTETKEEATQYDRAEAPTPADDSTTQGEYQEKIIYNVNMSLECGDVDEAVQAISNQAKSMGGYVSYSNSYKSGGNKYASMQIRVPSDRLDETISFVKTLGEVPSEYMSTEDITDQYYDIVARLGNEEKQEAQLLQILEKAETIEDILNVRRELGYVQANIESYKGTIKRWDSLVDYSTVDISISPTPSIVNEDDKGMRLIPLGETGQAMVRVFKQSAVFVANAFSLLLRVITALIIPAAIIAPIVLLIVFFVKRSKRKANQNKDQ